MVRGTLRLRDCERSPEPNTDFTTVQRIELRFPALPAFGSVSNRLDRLPEAEKAQYNEHDDDGSHHQPDNVIHDRCDHVVRGLRFRLGAQ